MKKFCFCMTVLLFWGVSHSQTVAEWTRQRKTQLKYLRQQILSLQVYISQAQKGYGIVKDGLNFIGEVKNGELSLHKAYFSSLATVSPSVRHYPKLGDIVRSHQHLIRLYRDGMRQVRSGGQFTIAELNHIDRSFRLLVESSGQYVSELITLLQVGSLTMTDDERLRRIDLIQAAMREKEMMAAKLKKDSLILTIQRSQELSEGKVLRKLYGINE